MDWYPHYIDDFDADTLHLTAFEDGCYSRLLRWYYKNERPLPDDDVALAAICRVGLEEWRSISPKVRSFFVTRDARMTLHHKRCDKVIVAQNKRRKDWKSRQEKLRKNNIVEDVTRDTRVSHASIGEDRRGEDIRTTPNGVVAASPDGAAPQPLTLDLGDGSGQQVNGHRTVTPKTPRRRPRQAFPADFVLTEDMATYSRSKLPATRPQILFEAFRNYHTAQGSLMANWPAAWRTWVDREARPRGGHK